MMRISNLSLCLGVFAVVGCVTAPTVDEKAVKPPVAAAPARPPSQRVRVPVSPEQVSETNASEKAEALRQELDRESQR